MTQKNPLAAYFRTIFFYFIFMGTIPLTALLMRMSSLIPLGFNPWMICRQWGKLLNFVLTRACGVKIVIKGFKNPDPSPAIIIANHTGPWETVCFPPVYPNDITYVVKKQLVSWKYNLFGAGLKALKPIPISREANSGDFSLIKEMSEEHFKEKRQVLIFPGGTRKALSESLDFPPVGVLLAKKLKCRVIPIFIDSERWARGHLIKDYGMIHPGKITVSYGEPIPAETISTSPVREVHGKILDFFKTEYQSLIQEASHPVSAP